MNEKMADRCVQAGFEITWTAGRLVMIATWITPPLGG
jgi:hypothetical protein